MTISIVHTYVHTHAHVCTWLTAICIITVMHHGLSFSASDCDFQTDLQPPHMINIHSCVFFTLHLETLLFFYFSPTKKHTAVNTSESSCEACMSQSQHSLAALSCRPHACCAARPLGLPPRSRYVWCRTFCHGSRAWVRALFVLPTNYPKPVVRSLPFSPPFHLFLLLVFLPFVL